MRNKITNSPIALRVVPFFIFLLLTFLQGKFGEESRYWFYLAKTLAGAGMLWAVWTHVAEMRWKFSWEAVVVGIAVFALWVGLDNFYPKFGKAGTPWNPHEQFGIGSSLAWMFVIVRLIGSTLVVPPLEESFIVRASIGTSSEKILPPGRRTISLGRILITSAALASCLPMACGNLV